jgi:hypothetical protein
MKIINKFRKIKITSALVLFILVDIVSIGMGMGVPFFSILLGIPLGWFLVLFVTDKTTRVQDILWWVLIYAAVAAGITVLGMLMIWLPMSTLLFDPTNDLTMTGVPLILYEPRASFIGWLVLMIVISPVLQVLTTLFGAYLTLLGWMHGQKAPEKA